LTLQEKLESSVKLLEELENKEDSDLLEDSEEVLDNILSIMSIEAEA
jgi:hypothetical protein